MAEPRASNRGAVVLVIFVVACVWVLAGLPALGSFSDAHNPSFTHVPARLSDCGGNGCQATFSLHGRSYTVSGANGSDSEQVMLYVEPGDPYIYAQARSWLDAYGLFLLLVVLTVVGAGAWLYLRRRRAQTPPAASRS